MVNTLKVLSKVKGMNALDIGMNKLIGEYKLLFDSKDIWNLLGDLSDEMLFMLTTCIKYKTGKINIKKDYSIDDLKSYPAIYSTYDYSRKNGYPMNDRYSNYTISKEPGFKAYNSRSSNDFDLLAQKYLMIDGDMYFQEDNLFTRALHLNRLRWHANQKRTKVNTIRVEKFIEWMETLTKFKHKLYKFGGEEWSYNQSVNEDGVMFTPNLILTRIVEEFGGNLTVELLPKIKDRLKQLGQEKQEALDQGNEYLKQIKESNLAARVLAEIKN